jgi:hypothetical protein
VYQDDHYKDWPFHTTDEEIKENHYFQPLNARETLATFLEIRADCLVAAGQLEKAREAAMISHNLAPHFGDFKKILDSLDGAIQNRDKQVRWKQVLTEVAHLNPPEGERFEHFRDEKIDLQLNLFRTGDLDCAEKALESLKMELAAEDPPDTPARITLSTENPQAHPTIDIAIMPEKVRYMTIDGRALDLLVKSPEQAQSFLREQRILDKVAEIKQHSLQAAGLGPFPWQALRPSSFNPPPGVSREEALRAEEDRLDKILMSQQADGQEEALRQMAQADALSQSVLPPEAQAAINMVNGLNALNGQSRNSAIVSPPFSPAPGMQEVQNALNLVNNLGGLSHGAPILPAQAPGPFIQPAPPPQNQSALDAVRGVNELKRQLDLLQQSQPTNSSQTGKAQK